MQCDDSPENPGMRRAADLKECGRTNHLAENRHAREKQGDGEAGDGSGHGGEGPAGLASMDREALPVVAGTGYENRSRPACLSIRRGYSHFGLPAVGEKARGGIRSATDSMNFAVP